MGNNDFVSGIKPIPHQQNTVFRYLSDLNHLAQLKEKLNDPANLERLQQEADKNNIGNLKEKLDDVAFDRDSITIKSSPIGNISLRIIEREEPKTIKFQGEGTPFPVTLWIQLLPANDGSCKMRLTLRAELNMFIRNMIKGKLEQGLEILADRLASIPYNDNNGE
jgi:hypothetical protein